MDVIDLRLHDMPVISQRYVVAIGFFDGLHRGHQALIEEVLKQAREKDLTPAVMLFHQHPLTVLKGQKTRQLTSFEDRVRLLEKAGIKTIFRIIFTKEVADLSPQQFIDEFLNRIGAAHVVVGYDFHFGKNNSGSADSFKNQAFAISVVPGIMYDAQQKISTSLIKSFLDEGNVEKAAELLSRPFTITGQVIHGKARGRTMGFPTANVDYDHYYLPKRGVYGVYVSIHGKRYSGMANIGKNPTFHDIDRDSLEINIFDFDEDIYDEEIAAEFICFERGEQTFSGMDALMATLKNDQKKVRKMLEESHL